MSDETKHLTPPTRFKIWRYLLVRPIVGVSLTLIAVLSNLEWLRDHVVPVALRGRLQFEAVPQVSWQTWVTLTAIMVVALTLEAAFRQNKEFHEYVSKSLIAFEPAIVIRYACVREGMWAHDEVLSFLNVGDLPVTNVSIEGIEIGGHSMNVSGSIQVLMPNGPEATLNCSGLESNLHSEGFRIAKSAGRKYRVPACGKMTLHCYDRTQTRKATVDYDVISDEGNKISLSRTDES